MGKSTTLGGMNYGCLVHDQIQETLIVTGTTPPGPPKETPSARSFAVVGGESIFPHHIVSRAFKIFIVVTRVNPGESAL
jgi:hypothetical protein